MRLRVFTAAALAAAAMMSAAPAALAQAACTDTQFGPKTGQAYMDAENALYGEKNVQKAKQKIDALKAMQLNCYERGAAIKLSAAVNVQAGDYRGAARDLEEAMATGGIAGDAKVTTYYQIAQLYLQMDDLNKALSYLEKWIAAGGEPDQSQAMQLASLYQKMGNNQKALYYLERMLARTPNPDKTAIDFAVYLYNDLGQKAKLATFLSDKVIPRFAGEKKYWDIMASLYQQGNEDRKAFEVVKAMYLSGMAKDENDVMRVVNFYNMFNAPYEAAKVLEKEMNAGRVKTNPEKLEMLANLYQVAREYDRAIPVVQKMAKATNSGKAYERLGRSYFEMKKYDEAEKALRTALNKGNLQDAGFAWVLIGQMAHERGNRKAAREAFNNASKLGAPGGRGWLEFMDSEDETKEALRTFDTRVKLDELRNVKKICDQTAVLGQGAGEQSEKCKTVEADIARVEAELGEGKPKDGEEAQDASATEGEAPATEGDKPANET